MVCKAGILVLNWKPCRCCLPLTCPLLLVGAEAGFGA